MKKLTLLALTVVAAALLTACATKSFYVEPVKEGGIGNIVEEKNGAWELIFSKSGGAVAAAAEKALKALNVEAQKESGGENITVFTGMLADEALKVRVRGLTEELSIMTIQVESAQAKERVRQVVQAVSKEL